MATDQVEREDKYDVAPGFVLPDLDSIRPDGARTEPGFHELVSTYFDTPGHDLLRNRLTLRRRQGDVDAGWQLKVPSGGARVEVRLDDPADADTSGSVPAELAGLLTGVRRGQELAPVARVSTRRTTHRVLDASGALLAEVADDQVHATDLGPPAHSTGGGTVTATQWREVEVEAGPGGDEDLLAAIGHLLIAAGAVPSAHASKLGRVLGSAASVPPAGPDSTLADLVGQYIRTQCAAIVAGDLGLRRRQDVVHPTRVAIRRLRSTLRTFAPLFHADSAAELEAELVWFAGLLGGVRDADVLRLRLQKLVAALPAEQVLGPVQSRIDNDLGARRREHEVTLMAELDSPRFLALLDRLEGWRTAPPFSPRADAPAADAKRYLRQAGKKLWSRVDRAAAGGAEGDDEIVHRARKAGKRFRYAAELSEPALGPKAREQIKQGEQLQDLLGEHQDSVVSAEALRQLGAAAGTTPGENGFTFGLLLAQEVQRAADVRARLGTGQFGPDEKVPASAASS